jgi:hypothetical protein
MKRSLVLVATVLLLLFVVFGVGGWRIRVPGTAHPAAMAREGSPSVTPDLAAESARTASASGTPVANVSTVPLPAADLPVAAVLPELRRRANAGDARAGCRLAFELIRCAAYVDGREPVDRWLRKREEEAAAIKIFDGRPHADQLAEQQILLAGRAKECAEVPVAQFAQIDDDLYRAAASGNLEAMLRYIDGQGFGLVGSHVPSIYPDMGYLHHPGFERWRREAPRMAQALLNAGEPAVLFLLSDAYSNDESPFAGLYPDDRARAWAYVEFQRGRIGRPQRDPSALTPAERAAAAAIEQELLAGPMRDVVPDPRALDAVMHPAYSFARDQTAACE